MKVIILLALIVSCADRDRTNPLDPYNGRPPVAVDPVWTLVDSMGYKYQISEKRWVTSARSCLYYPNDSEWYINYIGWEIDVKFDVYILFTCYPRSEPPKSLWIRKKGINEPL